jgi:hypothetical protein
MKDGYVVSEGKIMKWTCDDGNADVEIEAATAERFGLAIRR